MAGPPRRSGYDPADEMSPLFASFWTRLGELPPLYLVLWAALGVLTALLIFLMRTPWGRERPTHRYVLLSLVAHLALICLATTVRFMAAPPGEEAASPLRVRIVMRAPPSAQDLVEQPIEPPPVAVVPDEPIVVSEQPANEAPVESPPREEPAPPLTPPPLMPEPERSEPAATPPPQASVAESVVDRVDDASAAPHEQQESSNEPPQSAVVEPVTPTPPSRPTEPTSPPPTEPIPSQTPPSQVMVSAAPAPTAYSARQQEERIKVVEQEGGSRATEEAVAGGLAWLAAAQSREAGSRDGRWDAGLWSAGQETQTLGHNRRGAGRSADTGISGLALLAFLGAGHTHEEGPYAENVRAGLTYLLRTQTPEGSLAGDAGIYAQTYCHSMATFALAEALATTKDSRLEPSVRRAVDFLVARQDRAGGGWRYEAGAEGDMSQMGWIVMALRSAELGGIDAPPTVWSSIERFVRSTQRGRANGLACYQPRTRGGVSRTMTAEALYCRQILGWQTARTAASDEAINHLIGRLPGNGKPNLYYWYYAALALHHHKGSDPTAERAWQTWNAAMSRTLTASQIKQGSESGSWSPNTMWGGYGGRVYSTALATMCLEVYYRYDAQEVARDPWIAARPGNLRR